MIQTISEHPAVTAGIIGTLVAVVVYFLRKVAGKIDDHSTLISGLSAELKVQLATMRSNIKEDVSRAFNEICAERQGSCSRLQQAKLDTLTATHVAICAKLARLDQERRDDWSEQRRWNDKIETTIYRDKGQEGGYK
jgi:hypothetical protein